jgi:SAM-dependent methyltransferase
MFDLKSRLARFLRRLLLRARYYRKSVNLQNVLSRQGILVDSSLDLGSGPKPRNPFGASNVFGVDIRSFDINPNVKKCALGIDSIPFGDNAFDAITAYDLLEHIPRVSNDRGSVNLPFINLMNEIWRVLKVGGVFYSETPCFPMKEAFQDPTHVNIMTEDTLPLYFGERRWAKIYGYIGSFVVIDEGWLGSKYFCFLKKISSDISFNVNDYQH